MPDLEYTIKTLAELAGAEAAQKALERQIGAAKALGQDYTELQAKLDKVNAALEEYSRTHPSGGLFSELGEESKEAEPKLAGFGERARGIHSALFLIAREAGPAAGAAIAALTSVATGGFFAAVFAVREFFNWINQLEQKAEEFREQQAAMWVAAKKGADDVATSADDFAQKLVAANDKEADLKGTFSGVLAVLNAQLEDHKKILEAMEKEQLAAAKGDAAQEAAIRSRFEKFKETYDLGAEQKRIEAQRAYISDLSAAQPFFALKASGAEGMLEVAKKNQSVADEALKQAAQGKTEAQLKAAADALQPHAARYLQTQTAWWQEQGLSAADAQSRAQADLKNDPRFKAIFDFQAFEEAKKNADAYAKQIKILTGAVTEAETARDENKKTLKLETDKLKEMTGVYSEHELAAKAGGEIKTATGIADRLMKGEAVTGEESGFVIRLAQAATGHVQTLAQAVELFEKSDPQQLLNRVLTVVEKQNAGFTALYQRVQILERSQQTLEARQQSHLTQ